MYVCWRVIFPKGGLIARAWRGHPSRAGQTPSQAPDTCGSLGLQTWTISYIVDLKFYVYINVYEACSMHTYHYLHARIEYK